MRLTHSGVPPPIPERSASTREDTAPCGARLQRADDAFCSLCFDPLACGVRLSDGELLCAVCAACTFDTAEQHEALALAPRVALMARVETDGSICRDDLRGLRGRGLELVCSLRLGEELRLCGCLPGHVRGRVGVFVGYDTRRRLALLRLGGAIACMRMDVAEDALMLRRPGDQSTALHSRMLQDLVRVANRSTLYGAVTAVKAAHTLCGSSILAEAEAILAQISEADPHEAREMSAYEAPPSELLPMRMAVSPCLH
jgi:hypothetical protein